MLNRVHDVDRCPVLLLTPSGRDFPIARALLDSVRIASLGCANVIELASMLGDEICCAVVADEALNSVDFAELESWVASQAPWSDLPFIVLTRRGSGSGHKPAVARLSKALGNVTFIERPFHPTTFLSVVETARRGRYRQFEARARIRELHEGEARLLTALTAGNLGSWSLDLASRTLTASSTCKVIFGRGPHERFAYDDLFASVHPEDRARMQAAIAHSVETGCDYAIEYRTVWPDGTVHWADMRARAVRNDSNQVCQLTGVSSDITARKNSEEELRRLNESLEVKVIERTSELEEAHHKVIEEIRQRERTEELLRQVQKLEMIGQLTGGIAHDFNNLLMAITANLELVRKEVSAEDRVGLLVGGALRGAQRGAALTQRLLAFARQQALKVEPVQISALLQGMTDLLDRSINSMIELHITAADGLPYTLVDANQVELAVLNLVVNARDAMPDGGTISIDVDTIQIVSDGELPAGDYVRVVVSDTGTGMDSATLAKATEPFFTTKEIGKGTGLGLSMIHGLTRQLSGALRLESTPGEGTKVMLLLPAVEIDAKDVDVTHEPLHLTPVDAPLARATILVVDDDPLISTSTAYLLLDLGQDVIEVNSGAEALEILRSDRAVDVLLTDYSMPKMTGVELAHAARKLRPSLPIILATGYAELPDGPEAALPRLRKPYEQRQLLKEIAKAVSPGR